MNSKHISLALAMIFTVTTASLSSAAVAIKCQVTSIEGSTVIFDCGSKAKKFKKGDKVTVKPKDKKNKKDKGGC